MAKAKDKDIPTWAYRVSLAAVVLILGGLTVWFLNRLVSDFDNFGRLIFEVRQEQAAAKTDLGAIRKDVERIEKNQQRQEEKAEKFERDTQRRFERIDEKIDRKQDRK